MWSFRVVKTTLLDGGIRYAVHEAVYGRGEDNIDDELTISELEKLGISWTEDPVGPEFYFRPGEKDDARKAVKAIRRELMDQFKATTWPLINGDTERGTPLLKAVPLEDDD